jgi:hypothetical protein
MVGRKKNLKILRVRHSEAAVDHVCSGCVVLGVSFSNTMTRGCERSVDYSNINTMSAGILVALNKAHQTVVLPTSRHRHPIRGYIPENKNK